MGSITNEIENKSPQWVEGVCQAVVRFHDRSLGLSLRDAFEQASADMSDRSQFLKLVSNFLLARPDLVHQWTIFSGDTRSTPWPYFSFERFEVGFVSVKGGFEDVQRWETGPEACADYLYRVFKWVLCHER